MHRFVAKILKASSYIAQYPVLRTVQCALHFTSLTDLFTQTPSRLLWEASSHMLQLMCDGCSYTYPPSIARYSFIQLSELEQCRMKELAQGFNTAAQDSNLGSRSREFEGEALPLSHCALPVFVYFRCQMGHTNRSCRVTANASRSLPTTWSTEQAPCRRNTTGGAPTVHRWWGAP